MNDVKKIAIFGVGSMGAIYAAYLGKAGHEVWLVDPWQEHLQAIADNGLRITRPDHDFTVLGMNVADSVKDLPKADWVIIATKSAFVRSVAAQLDQCITPKSSIITIQNGLGALDQLLPYVCADQVILGVAEGFGASVVSKGHIHHAAMKQIRLGQAAGGGRQSLESVVKSWQQAGFPAQGYDDIHQLVWEKLLCNVTLSASCTVFGVSVGEVMDTPDWWAIALGAMDEAYRVGRHLGINFSFDDPEAYVTDFARRVRSARPSMLQDHQAKRCSEIDAINGQIETLGRQSGILTPYNQTLCAIIRAKEAQFTRDKAQS